MEYVARTPDQLGPILKSCRLQRGMSQHVAGTKVGLTQSKISFIEGDAGRTTVDSLYKVLSALGLELVVRDKGSESPEGSREREW